MAISRLKSLLFGEDKKPKETEKLPEKRVFSTDFYGDPEVQRAKTRENLKNTFQPIADKHLASGARDSRVSALDASLKGIFSFGSNLPETLLDWYAGQGFIGYQNSALLSQHWLISKCCSMPAEDAVRKGYEITGNDNNVIPPEVLDEIRKLDTEYNLMHNLFELIQMGRIFGIRIAMFLIESDDPDYYAKPFNLDGVTPGSYKGITQIDPYWITPQLDDEAAGDPASINFYEPTWWRITGKLVHRTHLIVYRTEEVPDILKPAYIYGGIPIPQKIYERVYAAERTANEAPMLALTKRTKILRTDMTMAIGQQGTFEQRLTQTARDQNNYGVWAVDGGMNEEVQQFDTSLSDLDAVIMTQYQIVAAAANVPAVKLLGTSPKGFNTTGEYEEASYHEMLESLQEKDLTPLVQRHHEIVIRSEICPMFGMEPFDICVQWNKLDAMTEEELAVLNKTKAETGSILIMDGAIDGEDERNRVINDTQSGYNGMSSIESTQTELEDA